MRKNLSLLAFIMLTTLMFVRCADEQTDPYDEDTEIQFMASAQWKCGRTMTGRAGSDIEVDEADIPQLLHITVGDGPTKQVPTSHPSTFAIAKTPHENDNSTLGYTAYHDQYRVENLKFDASGLHAVLKEEGSRREFRSIYTKGVLTGLRVEANTLSPRFDGSTQANIPQAWDNDDIPTVGRRDHLTTKEAFGGSTEIDGKHLFLTLGHVTAMLRLHIAVSEAYSKVRYIDLKSITINSQPVVSGEHLILKTAAASPDYSQHTLFGYSYIKPASDNAGTPIATIPSVPLGATLDDWTGAVGTATPLTFVCTYDIYDKDAGKIADFTQGKTPTAAALTAAAAHLTRYNVTATNTVTLSNASITAIKAGYYYDLYITINPDYLYVLSEHDNKHLIVN